MKLLWMFFFRLICEAWKAFVEVKTKTTGWCSPEWTEMSVRLSECTWSHSSPLCKKLIILQCCYCQFDVLLSQIYFNISNSDDSSGWGHRRLLSVIITELNSLISLYLNGLWLLSFCTLFFQRRQTQLSPSCISFNFLFFPKQPNTFYVPTWVMCRPRCVLYLCSTETYWPHYSLVFIYLTGLDLNQTFEVNTLPRWQCMYK